jgi:hypothetical protein
MKIEDRKKAAIILGERTGLNIDPKNVWVDNQYFYLYDPADPDSVTRFKTPLPIIAEPWDDIPFDKSPFMNAEPTESLFRALHT